MIFYKKIESLYTAIYKNLLFIIKVIIILLLFSFSLHSQIKNGRISIESKDSLYSTIGEWKFRNGDNISWAGPDYDASAWEIKEFPPPMNITDFKMKSGYSWYRLEFTVNKDILKDNSLFISIPRFFRTYEAYLNGKKFGGRGSMPDSREGWKWGFGGYNKIFSSDKIHTDRKNILAIRVYNKHYLLSGTLSSYFSFIGIYNPKSNLYLLSSLIYFSIGIIALLLGLYCLIVFRGIRDKMNLWFSFYSITQGIYSFLIWLPETLDTPDTQIIFVLFIFTFVLNHFFLIIFLLSFFKSRLERFKKFIYILLSLILLFSIIVISTWYLPLLRFSLYFILLCNILIFPYLIYITVSEIKRNNKEIKYILAGIIMGIACLIIDFIQRYWFKISIIPDFLWLLSPIGAFIFTLTIYLSIGSKYTNFINPKEVKKRKQSFLKEIDTEKVFKQLTDLVEKEKIFTDCELSLNSLAARLSLTSHQLSQFLNDELNNNFNSFINKYRIEEAKRLLTEEAEMTVTYIAYNVGFNSLSSFYNVFKNYTGKSPKDYRKENGL